MSKYISCPNCAESIIWNATVCRFCTRGLSLAHFKECRACGEMVRHQAIKCRFCLSMIPEAPSGGEPGAGAPVRNPSPLPTKGSSVAIEEPKPSDDEHDDKNNSLIAAKKSNQASARKKR